MSLRCTATPWWRPASFRAIRMLAGSAVVLTALAGCGGDDDGPTASDLTGVYFLTRVNGNAVPYTIVFPNGDLSIYQSGEIRLAGGNAFTLTRRSGSSTLTSVGTYRLTDPSTIQFFDDTESDTYFGVLSSGNTVITIGAGSDTELEFRR